MALQKQAIPINFVSGVDTKSDRYQIPLGHFQSRNNSVFDTQNALTKRNGYQQLTVIPDDKAAYLTTFNGNLTSLGSSVQAYIQASKTWSDKGSITPIDLTTLPVVRNTAFQFQSDAAIASNGLACVVYSESSNATGTPITHHKYTVIDSATGQNIIPDTEIAGADSVYGTPRVFLLGSYFVILYVTHPGAYQIEAVAVSTSDPTQVTAPFTVATNHTPATTVAWDAVVSNSRLYVAFNNASGGASVRIAYISAALTTVVLGANYVGEVGTTFSLTVDSSSPSAPIIYISYYDSAIKNGHVAAVDANANTVLAPTLYTAGITIDNITSTAQAGVSTQFYEVHNTYSYNGVLTNYIKKNTVSQAGAIGTASVVVRSVGLASKAFLENGVSYFLTLYQSNFQPTNFLINGSGEVISILSASNAGIGYPNGLPNPTLIGSLATISYLFRDSIQAVNKTQGLANPAGVYAQLGVKLVTFNFAPTRVLSAEIGQSLNFTGGYLGMYDGVAPVEQGFFLYPDNVLATPSAVGGSMAAQQYFYQTLYSWADNQGNIFKSAPSLPLAVTTASATSSVVLDIPTLRLTYKTNVTIEIYRWSAAQQAYYLVTSIQQPIINDKSVDFISYTDTLADNSIIGNSLIYTSGGVLEDIVPPATDVLTLFNNRLWLVDAEDRNLLWFSKPVFAGTPVEFTDLLTIYVAPTTGSEGSTGPVTAIAPMDDKLIVFKENAIGYISGTGPDITGANNQYSDFVLITAVVGCTNPSSIVFTPSGLMFQSNKGIWILSRNLSTDYIGVPVEAYTDVGTVSSAENIPTTNQVRFTLSSGITLLYDYFYQQWGTSTPIPAITSTIYENLHTYIDKYHRVFQETPGLYLDGSKPVTLSFTTGWMNLAGLQGFERFYEMYLLGQYKTAFKLKVDFAYDYNESPSQSIIVTPEQSPTTWGSQNLWGSGKGWGDQSRPFEARIFPEMQKCESFQITVTELFDPSFGTVAGEGLSLSGLNLVVGMKKGYRVSSAARSFG